jgi:voltage-gated potassium channel Kch
MSAPRVTSYHERPRWQWWVVIVAAPVALLSGAIGFYLYDLEHLGHASWLTSVYYAAQMFILHTPHLEGDVNVPLELGRWLAAAVFGVAATSTLYHVFAAEWQMFRLRFTNNHMVVCGLGKLGLLLALEFRKGGWRVVAIEASPTASSVQQARDHGITVLVGDARTRRMLSRARVQRARRVLAVSSDEQSNVGIAALTGSLVAFGQRRAALTECWLFVTSPHLRRALRGDHLFQSGRSGYRVNIRGLDFFTVAARKALQDDPLDHRPVAAGSETRVHLVVVGFGEMGQALALQAARIGHFANGCGWPNGRKLRVTVMDARIQQRWTEFAARYPAFESICEVRQQSWTPEDPGGVERLFELCPAAGPREEVVTFAVCVQSDMESAASLPSGNPLRGDDAINLSLALALAPRAGESGAQVLVQAGERRGFGALLDADTRNPELAANLRAFGVVEDLCSIATLVDEEQDRLAVANHECYRRDLERRRKAGENIAPRPAEVPWEALEESFRDSNRQAADHIPVKLRALGYHIESVRGGQPLHLAAGDAELEMLARMEHARWCAEKWLDGWRFGEPRDDAKKVHPDLRPWDALPVGERQIDTMLVTGIAVVLGQVGKGAYR